MLECFSLMKHSRCAGGEAWKSVIFRNVNSYILDFCESATSRRNGERIGGKQGGKMDERRINLSFSRDVLFNWQRLACKSFLRSLTDRAAGASGLCSRSSDYTSRHFSILFPVVCFKRNARVLVLVFIFAKGRSFREGGRNILSFPLAASRDISPGATINESFSSCGANAAAPL